MNKKLLSSTALVSALMISGAALAEFKVGGDVTATIVMGSDEGPRTATGPALGSGEYIGNETNLMLSGKKDLSGGLTATYTGKLEFDSIRGSNPDHEYELKIGSGDLYVAFANDNGQSNRSSMTPFVSYPIGSTAAAVSPGSPSGTARVAFGGDSYLSAVHSSNNIAFGGKVGTGNFVIRYAPNASTQESNDVQPIDATTGTTTGSGMMLAYNGKFGPVGLNIGYTTEENADEANSVNDNAKEQRIGLNYDFGGARIGADLIRYESGSPTGAGRTGFASTSPDRETRIFGIAYPASNEVTIGAYYQTTEDDSNVVNRPDEDVRMISIGYNLGGGSVALSVVDIEDRNNVRGADNQGIMLTTKVGF